MNIEAKRNKAKKEKSCQKRISSIILFNGINFFLLRTPSLIIIFYGFVYRYDSAESKHFPDFYLYFICRSIGMCAAVNDFSIFLYLFSIIFQFIFFLKFDKNFMKGFLALFKK